ncbi:B3 domain-containing protein Os04g0386900-like [Spinacia oleracea]|uniref:B3 domain-containing protein Os04g0386900-like n=1 Tax=Spinacia oleracea TaxID=3562 RepID=A0A9R0JHU7_SPIOL|nr:B3 domain-containing protein Os04g0386900-like [Spinacia oleracea]XP_056682450.1 B3 domain-containing protein Os04g0386900-like [Spinacia oleracea]
MGYDDIDIDIEPYTGAPYFHLLVTKTMVNPLYQLTLPRGGARLLPDISTEATLVRGKREWKVFFNGTHKTHKRLELGWKAFVDDNQLKVEDFCTFEIMPWTPKDIDSTPLKFKVQVFRCDLPAALLEKIDGTSNNPALVE